jgi:hypothetical protein
MHAISKRRLTIAMRTNRGGGELLPHGRSQTGARGFDFKLHVAKEWIGVRSLNSEWNSTVISARAFSMETPGFNRPTSASDPHPRSE